MCQHIPLHVSYMGKFINEVEEAATTSDSPLTPPNDHSEPENGSSSASDYFEDDEIYPANYDDESVRNSSDSISEAQSSTGQSVRAPFYMLSPEFHLMTRIRRSRSRNWYVHHFIFDLHLCHLYDSTMKSLNRVRAFGPS